MRYLKKRKLINKIFLKHGINDSEDARKALDSVLRSNAAEMNIDLIDQCLKCMYGDYAAESAPHQEEVLKCISKRFSENSNKVNAADGNAIAHIACSNKLKQGGFRLITAIAIVLLITTSGTIFYKEWFTSCSTKDQQQYQVQGIVLAPTSINESQADEEVEKSSLITTDLHALVGFLGYKPELPNWLPDGWTVKQYYGIRNDRYERIVIDYINCQGEGDATYQIVRYKNIEDAYLSFEQDAEGECIVNGSSKFYITTNFDRIQIIWQTDSAVYTISGNLLQDDAMHMAKSIEGDVDLE